MWILTWASIHIHNIFFNQTVFRWNQLVGSSWPRMEDQIFWMDLPGVGEHELVDSMRKELQKHKGYNWEDANFGENWTIIQQRLGWKLIPMMRTCMQMRVSPHMCLQNIFVPPPILRCEPLMNFWQLWKFGFDDSGCLFFLGGIYIPEKKDMVFKNFKPHFCFEPPSSKKKFLRIFQVPCLISTNVIVATWHQAHLMCITRRDDSGSRMNCFFPFMISVQKSEVERFLQVVSKDWFSGMYTPVN